MVFYKLEFLKCAEQVEKELGYDPKTTR